MSDDQTAAAPAPAADAARPATSSADAFTAPDPRAKEGSDLATAPAAATGTAEPTGQSARQSADQPPGERLSVGLPGDTLCDKVRALHERTFVGSRIAGDTDAWNLVHAYTADIVKLIEEIDETLKKR